MVDFPREAATLTPAETSEAEPGGWRLAREVDHRAKNALAVVQAIVRLAKRDTIDDYVTAVEGRIGALAQTHELLSHARWEGADILTSFWRNLRRTMTGCNGSLRWGRRFLFLGRRSDHRDGFT